MGVLRYSSNNSGGDWWLSTADWEALADAGWNVHWEGCDSEVAYADGVKALEPVERAAGQSFLGAVARSAAKAFDSPEQGVAEFEEITGQCASDEGCNCCGEPHFFTFTGDDGETSYGHLSRTSTLEW